MIPLFANSLGNLPLLSDAVTRSISPENLTGDKGKGGMATEGEGAKFARDLGRGWKISPCVRIPVGQTLEIASITGPGLIQQIWMTTLSGVSRFAILRFYWDNSPHPSVECPLGDFFASGLGACDGAQSRPFAQISSLAVCVNPERGFNCYWPMPFRRHCRITFQNIDDEDMLLYYQVNYALQKIPENAAYFHAQFRRVNPLPCKEVYTLLDGVEGRGQYVGTSMCWGVNNNRWWGEGEIKFYIDGDDEFPTICGTGVEDYFCGSHSFLCTRENSGSKQYQEFTTPYAGMPQVIRPDGVFVSQMRFGLYRWHIMDPVRFTQNLRVTIQALGWRGGGRFLPLQDDIASVAYWYQTHPANPSPPLPSKDHLEII